MISFGKLLKFFIHYQTTTTKILYGTCSYIKIV